MPQKPLNAPCTFSFLLWHRWDDTNPTRPPTPTSAPHPHPWPPHRCVNLIPPFLERCLSCWCDLCSSLPLALSTAHVMCNFMYWFTHSHTRARAHARTHTHTLSFWRQISALKSRWHGYAVRLYFCLSLSCLCVLLRARVHVVMLCYSNRSRLLKRLQRTRRRCRSSQLSSCFLMHPLIPCFAGINCCNLWLFLLELL